MLTIRPEQLQALARARMEQFDADVASWLREHYGDRYARVRDAALREQVAAMRERASAIGIVAGAEIVAFIELELRHGPDVERRAWAQAVLEGRDGASGGKTIDRLHAAARNAG